MSSSLSLGRRVRAALGLAGMNVTASKGCHGFCCGSNGGCTRAVSPHAKCPIRRGVLSTAMITSSYVATSTLTATFVMVKLSRTRTFAGSRPGVNTCFVCDSRGKRIGDCFAGGVGRCLSG